MRQNKAKDYTKQKIENIILRKKYDVFGRGLCDCVCVRFCVFYEGVLWFNLRESISRQCSITNSPNNCLTLTYVTTTSQSLVAPLIGTLTTAASLHR